MNSGIYTLKIESGQYSYSGKIVSSHASSGAAEIKHIETTPGMDEQMTSSDTEKVMRLKDGKSLIDMQYTAGDRLKLTGKSGIYRTVFMLVPTQTQTVTFNFVACTDADNNSYAVVKISSQIWMEESLKTTSLNDGSAIPMETDNYTWYHLNTPAYCWYNNDSVAYKNIYGALYNWHTIVDYLGGSDIAGGKMKDSCSGYWSSPNTGATNSSGFSGLPGGYRDGYTDGAFYTLGEHCYNWQATEYDTMTAWFCDLWNVFSNVGITDMYYKKAGFSVRCVKDR
jgi:uncharacterized protein (TIGR02145 family)